MVEEAVPLFVCAVGIPPMWVVEKLHAAGTIVMNMVGRTRHAVKALETGVDIICAQGTEAGGHTGEVSTMVLVPQIVDVCAGKALVVAAGGIYDGRQIAACLALGASGVWIGTAVSSNHLLAMSGFAIPAHCSLARARVAPQMA
eukprot:COSAG01_NODE_3597_length_5894_cov_1.898188_4_plen_144_part_00